MENKKGSGDNVRRRQFSHEQYRTASYPELPQHKYEIQMLRPVFSDRRIIFAIKSQALQLKTGMCDKQFLEEKALPKKKSMPFS